MLHNQIFKENWFNIEKEFPDLRLVEASGKVFLSGIINLVAEDGEQLDSYSVEIHPTADYPNRYPLLFEVGDKIPRNIDWHVYDDGHCCLSVPIEERIDCTIGLDLGTFIKKQVLGFLYNQTFRRKNGYFYRERSHGFLGSIEFYKEILKLQKVEDIFQGLSIATNNSNLKSSAKCFCGSKRKFRKCHRRQLRQLSKTGRETLISDFVKLKGLINQALI